MYRRIKLSTLIGKVKVKRTAILCTTKMATDPEFEAQSAQSEGKNKTLNNITMAHNVVVLS